MNYSVQAFLFRTLGVFCFILAFGAFSAVETASLSFSAAVLLTLFGIVSGLVFCKHAVQLERTERRLKRAAAHALKSASWAACSEKKAA